jgi:hypothetical protein
LTAKGKSDFDRRLPHIQLAQNPHFTRKGGIMSVHRFAGQRCLPLLAGALAFLVILLAGATSLHAQLSTQATITGTVTDSTGAVVSGATVTLTDDATKVSTVTKTNSDGVYIVRDLSVATYTVAITRKGFKTYTVSGVELHPTETVNVNATLAVGAETQNVTVNAVSTEVETSTPEVSADISSEEVSTLPMNGRNYQALAVMMPGVTASSQGSSLGTGAAPQAAFSPSTAWTCRAASTCWTACGTKTPAT